MKPFGTGFTTRFVCILLCTGGLIATAWAAPKHRPAPHIRTALQVAEALDAVIQPQFQKSIDTFGVGRFVIAGHDNIYNFDTEHVPALKRTLRAVAAAHRPYAVEFLHCAHKPAHFRDAKEVIDQSRFPSLEALILPNNHYYDYQEYDKQSSDWDDDQQPVLKKRVLPLTPELRRGQPLQRTVDDWLVVMRPVRAAKASCLGCHHGARQGDTLGVMVYVVKR